MGNLKLKNKPRERYLDLTVITQSKEQTVELKADGQHAFRVWHAELNVLETQGRCAHLPVFLATPSGLQGLPVFPVRRDLWLLWLPSAAVPGCSSSLYSGTLASTWLRPEKRRQRFLSKSVLNPCTNERRICILMTFSWQGQTRGEECCDDCRDFPRAFVPAATGPAGVGLGSGHRFVRWDDDVKEALGVVFLC